MCVWFCTHSKDSSYTCMVCNARPADYVRHGKHNFASDRRPARIDSSTKHSNRCDSSKLPHVNFPLAIRWNISFIHVYLWCVKLYRAARIWLFSCVDLYLLTAYTAYSMVVFFLNPPRVSDFWFQILYCWKKTVQHVRQSCPSDVTAQMTGMRSTIQRFMLPV